MSDIKICHITLGHDALDDRIFYKEAVSLRKIYPKISVLATGSEPKRWVQRIRIITVPRARIPLFTLRRLWSAARGEQARCFQLHEPQLLPLALLLKHRYHVKIIYDAHEHLPEMIANFSTRSRPVTAVLGALFSQMERWMIRTADAVVVTSDLLASRCLRWNRQVLPLFNYPRQEMFSGQDSPPLDLRDRYRSSRVIMYHGQLGRARGISMLIRATKLAAARIPGIKLLLLGPFFGSGYGIELIRAIDREDAHRVVDLLDPVPHPQVSAFLSLAEAGLVVLPSVPVFKQCLPIKLFEYMSCGVPVIASRFPAIERVVRSTRCGLLVEASDAEALADAIVHILSRREEAREMGRRGQIAVRNKYNWSRMEQRLFGLYQDVLEKP